MALSRQAIAISLSAALALASSVATAMQESASFTVTILMPSPATTATRVGCPVNASGIESCTAVTYSQYDPSVQVRLFAVSGGSTSFLGGTSGFLAGAPGTGMASGADVVGAASATLRAAQSVGSSTRSTMEMFSDAYADTRLLSNTAGQEIREVLYSW